MRSPMMKKVLLAGLAVLVAGTALASQVKLVTFGSGSGRGTGGSQGAGLTVGQAVTGRADHVAGNFMGVLGLWAALDQAQIVSLVGEERPALKDHLFRNYPNPFNPSTRISFTLEEEARVVIEVYDLRGRRVDTLLREVRPAGAHSVMYEPRDLASGVYLVLMRAGSFRASQRMMLVK